MKTKKILLRAFGMIALVLSLVSCSPKCEIQEITEDTTMNLGWEYSDGTYVDKINICYTDIRMKLTLSRKNIMGYSKTFILPRNCRYCIYQDSIVITTANAHKLKIDFWKDVDDVTKNKN